MVWKVWNEYGGSGMGEESLGLGWRALNGCKGPRNSMGVKDGYGGLNRGVRALVGCGGPDMNVRGFRGV